MPGTGKHRRPKSRSISRGFAAAGTGGAALALPLLGAAGAHAAGAPAAAPATAPATAPASAPQVPASLQAAPATAQAAPTVYTVVPGDHLSKIAESRHLSGGWEQLYADNRAAVGSDPSLIHPGLKLTLGAKGTAEAAPSRAAAPAAPAAPAEQSADSSESAEDASGSGGAEAPAAPARKAPAPKAPAKQQQAAPASAGFVSPVSGGASTAYKVAGSMWSSGYHTGVDFSASTGSTVKAVGAGTVVSAGWGGAYGNEVVIRHADGKYSQYAHLSQLNVSSGQSVSAGQTVGLSGATGNVTGPHLHFEIRTGPSYGSDIDPLAYLRSKGVSI
ncbi:MULTISPECIES: LysM peptidoglycan-binding domain-containing M23 family metallopeptidase [unclassified Streptomyces]|uniref:M23 family metallopeptidase n=1 Tax=unclassified Streptomyces TaxID=2593676 RepID=UPI000DC77FDA|nr:MULTISPECIES: LysM peptidoglycan-binding domain-containing M23 family metallopeptidase [unclassified Streptomyces]AWZ09060.1 peptidase [Streptomyces sp. ICC4]AWZ16808.1 peptidase [Streptomyces sp. ICC1]